MRPLAFVENYLDLGLLAAASAEAEAADFIFRLREQPGGAAIPVIVVGSTQDLGCIERAREAGEMLSAIGTPKYVGYARDVLASAER
jgi:response regulator RpfG family c-di-GMP phosphodiesterase